MNVSEIGSRDFHFMKRNVSSQAKRSFPKKLEFKTPENSRLPGPMTGPCDSNIFSWAMSGPCHANLFRIQISQYRYFWIDVYSNLFAFIGTYVRIWPKSHATTIIKSSKVRFFENRSHGISAQRYADK